LCAESGLRSRNRAFHPDIVACPLENGVFGYIYHDEKIPRRAATDAGISLAGYPDLRSVIDSGRDGYANPFFARHRSASMAGRAGRAQFAFAFALRTKRRKFHVTA